jgi:hypothetical protein
MPYLGQGPLVLSDATIEEGRLQGDELMLFSVIYCCLVLSRYSLMLSLCDAMLAEGHPQSIIQCFLMLWKC